MARLPLTHARGRGPGALFRAMRLTVPGSAHQMPEEIGAFLRLMARHSPERVCEIGVAHGGTTMLLAYAAHSIHTVIAIDVTLVRPRTLAALAPRTVDFTAIQASSFDPATVARVRQLLGSKQLDVLFIDGSHVYEDVRADYLAYRAFVREGGLIAFHDIVPDYGARFGQQTAHWAGGVPRLWAELRENRRTHEFVRDRDQNGFGIGVIEHDPAIPLPGSWSERN